MLVQLSQDTTLTDTALPRQYLDNIFIDEWEDAFSIRGSVYKFKHSMILFGMIYI